MKVIGILNPLKTSGGQPVALGALVFFFSLMAAWLHVSVVRAVTLLSVLTK